MHGEEYIVQRFFYLLVLSGKALLKICRGAVKLD